MKITLLNSLISVLVAGWCVFGVLVHGWQILFYPLAWAGIVTAFFVLNRLHDRKPAVANSDATDAAQKEQETERAGQARQAVIEGQGSTAVSAQ